jgi:hypothetical protein
MAGYRLPGKHACTVHTREVLERLEALVPLTDEQDTPVRPAELMGWISVEAENEPEVAEHGWRVDWDDGVGLLVHPDREDVADLLGAHVGVRSVVQLDREVLVVNAPSLCADGLHAAVMQAIAAANAKAHAEGGTRQPALPVGDLDEKAAATESQPEGPAPETPAPPSDDDYAARLVSGDARSAGHRVQVWVNQDGVLILPARTIAHGALDRSDNPRFQRATFTVAEAAELAGQHAGQWIPHGSLAKLELTRPGLFGRRWSATIEQRGGASMSFSWRGTRPHALLLWAYVVAKCGLQRVDGRP